MNIMTNEQISQSLIKSDNAFSTLIELKTIIPDNLKVKLFQATQGGILPSLEEWTDFLHFEFYLHGFSNLNNMGYSLSQNEIQLLKDCDCFVEELSSHTIRNYIGWGIPTEENVNNIVEQLENKQSVGLLEIGCGSGYWSSIFKHRLNIDVQACEINLRGDTPRPKFFNALNINAEEAMSLFPNYDILLVWPDINNVANQVIHKMNPGQILFLETNIDVTANRDFYKDLDLWFDLKSFNASIAFSGSPQKTYILEKRNTPKSELENTSFFSNQYKPYLNKIGKNKK